MRSEGAGSPGGTPLIFLMEVTRENFSEIFPSIVKSIQESSFVTIDCEFTGIDGPDIELLFVDSCSERYEKYG